MRQPKFKPLGIAEPTEPIPELAGSLRHNSMNPGHTSNGLFVPAYVPRAGSMDFAAHPSRNGRDLHFRNGQRGVTDHALTNAPAH